MTTAEAAYKIDMTILSVAGDKQTWVVRIGLWTVGGYDTVFEKRNCKSQEDCNKAVAGYFINTANA